MNIKMLLSVMIIASVAQASESNGAGGGGGGAEKATAAAPTKKRKSPASVAEAARVVEAPAVVVAGHDIDLVRCERDPKKMLQRKKVMAELERRMNALQIDVPTVKNPRQDGK